jgi:hypothetical protein
MPDTFQNFDPGALRAPAPHTWAIGRSTTDGGLLFSPAEADYLREMFSRLKVAMCESKVHPAMLEDAEQMARAKDYARTAAAHVAAELAEVDEPGPRQSRRNREEWEGERRGEFLFIYSRLTVLDGGLKPPPTD